MPRSQRYTRNLGRREIGPLPPRRSDAKYIRFEHASERFGVFSYLSDAREEIDKEGRAELRALMDWFNEHLQAIPTPAGMAGFVTTFRVEPGVRGVVKASARLVQ